MTFSKKTAPAVEDGDVSIVVRVTMNTFQIKGRFHTTLFADGEYSEISLTSVSMVASYQKVL